MGSIMRDYGYIDKFVISPGTKKIYANVNLNGDQHPVEIWVSSYYFDIIDDEIYLAFENLSCSREWIDSLLKNYLPKFTKHNRIKIPEKYGGIARLVL